MPLPTLLTTTVANACSSDGSVIVGSAPSGGGTVACWWDKATQTLTLLTQPVGETFTEAYDCSSDGSVIVGANGGSNAFWWDKTTGTPTTLSVGSGHNAQALGCSSDGSIIVGYYINFTTGQTAVWWNKSTNILTELNNLSSISTNGSLARGVSADGAVAVGISLDDSDNERAVWWNRSTGVVTLMPWPGGIQPFLNGMGPYGASLDGSIIVGSGEDSLGNVVACWWNKTTGTPTLLGQLPGNNGGRALAVSDDGTRISGWANDSSFNQWAVWWDKASGDIVKLDFDPSADNSVSDGGIGISADGNFVVGDNYINPGDVQTAVFWDISPPPPPDLLLQGRIFAAARAKGQRNLVTTIRARIRANSGLKGLLNWPDYSLPLQAKVTSGARALGALVPGNTVLAARIRANANLRQLLSGVTNIPVFPTLPVGFPVVVKPTFANISGSIPSGRSMRAPQQTLPIWEFELNFESLRDQTQNSQPFLPLAGFTDFTKLSQVFIANIGQYGKFLFDAWWDDSRLDQPIALGDGTSTRFLMVRTWGYGLIQFTEPVGSVNVITNVKINGTVQDPSTYFITSNNVLVFRSAPANGVTITSTFSYYYLCQFSEDMQDYSEFMKNRWTAKIKFRSVEGATPFTLASGPTPFPPPAPGPPAPGPLPDLGIIVAIRNGVLVGNGRQAINVFGDAALPYRWYLSENTFPITGLLDNRFTLQQTSFENQEGVACLTSDGTTAFGVDDVLADSVVMWNVSTGAFTSLTTGSEPPDFIDGCSDDGSVLVGSSSDFPHPIIWTGAVPKTISFLPSPPSSDPNGAVCACDSQGLVFVGFSNIHIGTLSVRFPCFWPSSTSQPTALGMITSIRGGALNGLATCCDAFAFIIGGWLVGGNDIPEYGNYPGAPFIPVGSKGFGESQGAVIKYLPCYWFSTRPNDIHLLTLPSGWVAGQVRGISRDGTIAVGWAAANDANGTIYPVIWDVLSGTPTVLPSQPAWPGLNSHVTMVIGGMANCISDDKKLVGGLVPAISTFGVSTQSITFAKYWNI